MRRTRTRWLAGALLSGAMLCMAGCGDDQNLIGPENQLEVQNQVDQFELQLSALADVTDRRTFEWQNTGTRATLDVSEEVLGGSAILTVRDADGTVLYEADIADDHDATTPAGTAGLWMIELELTHTTGTFNFRIQKTT